MGLLERIFRRDDVEKVYRATKQSLMQAALEHAEHVQPLQAAIDTLNVIQLPGNVHGEHYYIVADYLLAEYPPNFAIHVANAFHCVMPGIGFDPFGKVMIGAQFVDRKAGTPMLTRLSFARDHPKFYEYLTEKDCPERTMCASTMLMNGVFYFPSAAHAKRIFPSMFVVPEMKRRVTLRLFGIDDVLAGYITGAPCP